MKKILIKSTALCALCLATLSTTWAQQTAPSYQPKADYPYAITSYPGERYPLVNPAMPAYDKAMWQTSGAMSQGAPHNFVGNPGEQYPDNTRNVPRSDRALWTSSYR